MMIKTRFFCFLLFVFFLQIVLVSTATAVTRIMPLGNSITVGTCDNEPLEELEGYRQKLYLDLIDQGYDVDFVGGEEAGGDALPPFDIDHEGHGGWKADEIVNGNPDQPGEEQLDQWLVDHRPDIVLLHIGTNDISAGDNPADIVSEVDQILDVIFAYDPVIKVILARIINRANFSQETNDFNNLLPGMVQAHPSRDNIFIVNQEIALNYLTDMYDNLHPNMLGYNKMADVWFDELLQILPDPDPNDDSDNSDSSGGGCFICTVTFGCEMNFYDNVMGF